MHACMPPVARDNTQQERCGPNTYCAIAPGARSTFSLQNGSTQQHSRVQCLTSWQISTKVVQIPLLTPPSDPVSPVQQVQLQRQREEKWRRQLLWQRDSWWTTARCERGWTAGHRRSSCTSVEGRSVKESPGNILEYTGVCNVLQLLTLHKWKLYTGTTTAKNKRPPTPTPNWGQDLRRRMGVGTAVKRWQLQE